MTPTTAGPYAGLVQPPDPNPYSAPKADGYAPELDAEQLPDASTGQRFFTLVLDYVGMMVLELLAALGDEFAYAQDRLAREATLATATQRRSLRHLARGAFAQLHHGAYFPK